MWSFLMSTFQVTDAAVKAFVEERPGMTFVGLLATDAGFSEFLSGDGNLKVEYRCVKYH